MDELLINFLRSISLTNNWLVLFPEIFLVLVAVLLLGVDLFIKNVSQLFRNKFLFLTTLLSQIIALFLLFFFGYDEKELFFGGLIHQTSITQIMRYFFVLSAILVTILSYQYLKKNNLPKSEFYNLFLLILVGFMVLVQSANFVLFFIALELVTIGFYILISFRKDSVLSLEAAIKYLTLGGLSSAILLFGIVLLYGMSGNPELNGYTFNGFQFNELKEFIGFNSNQENLIIRLGSLLVISGVCFKLGLVPFQIWVPDVYQGAPTPSMAYLALTSKAAGIFILMNLLIGPFWFLKDFLIPLLSVLCCITILYSNISATGQKNIKRLIGLSGMSHASYLVIGVILCTYNLDLINVIFFYLLLYMISLFMITISYLCINDLNEYELQISDYRGLAHSSPILSGVMVISLGSLAGIPPFGGFIAKLLILYYAFSFELYALVCVALIGIIISMYYYFGWIREVFEKVVKGTLKLSVTNNILLILLVFSVVLILSGLYPALFFYFLN